MERNVTANTNTNTGKGFNAQEWARQKKAERESAFRMIDDMTEAVRMDGSRLRDCLDLMSRFPKYSTGNILLIAAQKPGAMKLGDSAFWKQYGIYIKKGETGIITLEAVKEYTRRDGTSGVSYNSRRIFDVSQTTAKLKNRPYARLDGRTLLRALMYGAPCGLAVDSRMGDGGAVARYDSSGKMIYVMRTIDVNKLFPAISQELAIAYMEAEGREFTEGENIAYCVSYILCKRNAVNTDRFSFDQFPEELGSMDTKAVKTFLNDVRNVSNSMSLQMTRCMEKQREAGSRDDAR